MTVYRHDGVNGDTNYNPSYPFKVRGSVDPNGGVIGGVHVSNLTYAIDIPVVTNNPFDIAIRLRRLGGQYPGKDGWGVGLE